MMRVLLTVALTLVLCVSCIETHPRWLRQQQALLAQELGVDVEDYGPAIRFPLGYLESRLTSGMSTREVHQLMPRHAAVYRCQNETGTVYREVYYFFSEEPNKAVRIEVIYTENGRLNEIRPDNRISSKLGVFGCDPGYWPE
jgi:hypothetical protein